VSAAFREQEGALTVEVQVQPRASRDKIGPLHGERVKVQLTAPPVEGAANEALRALLARALGVPRAAVTIVRGESGRKKTVRVEGARAAQLEAILDGAHP
jgi:uncharacterized protein (TIGR00251 family)